jgi:hypothetical protein
MKNFNRFAKFALMALVVSSLSSCDDEIQFVEEVVDFQTIQLQPNSYWNGSDGSGEYVFGSSSFKNEYNSSWGSWSGFSFSNTTDITTPGYPNQYSAYLSGGGVASNKYAVAYVYGTDATISFDKEVNLKSIKVTNSTYAYLSMLNGDQVGKKFVNGDWFKLTIKAYDNLDAEIGEVDFYLADYRNGTSKIVNVWENVDLKLLKDVSKVTFFLTSTDNGDWGMNTPAYFSMDDLVFEYLK